MQRYSFKNAFFCLPHLPFDAPVRGGEFRSEYRHPVWHGKTRMVWLPDIVKKFPRYFYSFWRNWRTWETLGHTDTAWQHRRHLCIASRSKKTALDVLYWSYTDTKHRAASLRQQSFLLYRTLVRVNAHKCAKFQVPSSISYWDTERSQNKNWELLICWDAP